MLSFIGALIVFLTFVIKEGLREHLKDVVDALGSAQNIFRIRTENAEIVGLLERIVLANVTGKNEGDDSVHSCESHSGVFYGNPYGQYGGMGMGYPGYPGQYDMAGQLGAIYGGTSQMQQQLMKGGMSQSAPGGEGAVAGGVKFYINADQLRTVDLMLEDMNHLVRDLPKEPTRAQHLTMFAKKSAAYHQEYSKSRDECRTEPNETDRMTSVLASNVNGYAAELLNNAELLRAKAARQYEICTWASYVLYSLGWGLGLVGRLYGGMGIQGDE